MAKARESKGRGRNIPASVVLGDLAQRGEVKLVGEEAVMPHEQPRPDGPQRGVVRDRDVNVLVPELDKRLLVLLLAHLGH